MPQPLVTGVGLGGLRPTRRAGMWGRVVSMGVRGGPGGTGALNPHHASGVTGVFGKQWGRCWL